jgi:hypothetical protein
MKGICKTLHIPVRRRIFMMCICIVTIISSLLFIGCNSQPKVKALQTSQTLTITEIGSSTTTAVMKRTVATNTSTKVIDTEAQRAKRDRASLYNTTSETQPHDSILTAPPHIRIQFPVLVASLFKSGTNSAHIYFTCGQQKSGHNSFGDCLQNKMNLSSSWVVCVCVYEWVNQ